MAASQTEMSAIHQAAEGSWPVVPAERTWGLVGLFGVTLSAGIAAWSYSIGGAVSTTGRFATIHVTCSISSFDSRRRRPIETTSVQFSACRSAR